jgi:hypothetical protein
VSLVTLRASFWLVIVPRDHAGTGFVTSFLWRKTVKVLRFGGEVWTPHFKVRRMRVRNVILGNGDMYEAVLGYRVSGTSMMRMEEK